MSKPTKTFSKYKEVLQTRRALSKSEILGLAWVLNGVKRVNITPDEKRALRTLLSSRQERPISKELTQVGFDWLLSKAFKKNGEPRNYTGMPFGYRERAIILDFKRFTWVGYRNTQQDCGNHNSPFASNTPIWRVHASNGAYFDYYVSGGAYSGGIQIHIV